MKSSWKNVAEPVIFFVALLVLWEILVEVIKVPRFYLAAAAAILWTAFIKKLPILGNHALDYFHRSVWWFRSVFGPRRRLSPSRWFTRAICRIPSIR